MFGQSFVFGGIAGGAAGVAAYLVVGGGGAGGRGYSNFPGGGGGGGDAKTSTEGFTFTQGVTYTITIGAGGTGNDGAGTSSSLIGTGLSITSGAGTGANSVYGPRQRSGGDSPNYIGGAGATRPNPQDWVPYMRASGGGGGGGASEAGGNGTWNPTSSGTRGKGGDGIYSSITGTEVGYAGGAWGAGTSSYSFATSNFGAGSSDSNRAGSFPSEAKGGPAPSNRGGGGGGEYYLNSSVYQGGSGVVILAIPTSQYSGTTTGSPTVTTFEGNTILTFTGSGSYTH